MTAIVQFGPSVAARWHSGSLVHTSLQVVRIPMWQFLAVARHNLIDDRDESIQDKEIIIDGVGLDALDIMHPQPAPFLIGTIFQCYGI
jgi:hypothetical protein